MRCEHCGRLQIDAARMSSTHCAPPFEVQPHEFSGLHPADQATSGSSLTRLQLIASTRKLVVIESPFGGAGEAAEAKLLYARLALRDSLANGEAPIASHLLYTQDNVLDDTREEQRVLGIACGFAWNQHAELIAVYKDLGISPGMQLGIDYAVRLEIPIEYRTIYPDR